MNKNATLLIICSVFCFIHNAWSQNDDFEEYQLMPWPKNIQKTNTSFIIDSKLSLSIKGPNTPRVDRGAVQFLRRLVKRTGVFIDNGFPLKNKDAAIEIHFDRISKLTLGEDESYSLKVNENKITIHAPTDVGVLRALQTLLQLVNHNANHYFFHGALIEDAPRFVWRGLLIDVARHFQPVGVLKRNLDAMASVKLNVFHWHLTDDQGFRIESKRYPKLQTLASDGLFYTQEQIKDVVAYASNLGIRVIPEIDVPGHASAILTAYPEYGSKENYDYAIERYAGVFDPTLDPTNEKTYVFLEHLFTEVSALFPDTYFHIGGDENEGKHWNENEKIQKFKKDHHLKNNHDLQTYFNIRLEKILSKLGKKLMGWDEIMTPNMPTTAVIHSWRSENEGFPKGGALISAAKKGYQTVLSNGYYIDRMHSVEHHYSVDPIADAKLTDDAQKRVLGGEATMWSELVTPETIDSRIWPRTAAIAERFWSEKEVVNKDHMLKRLKDVNAKLEELGMEHIKNRAVILRGLNDYKNNDALQLLSKICEPLKMYSRNTGGTEYKTFSPFSLFADACVADAEDAVIFNKNVTEFINGINKNSKRLIKNDLKKWSVMQQSFTTLVKNPKTKPLEPVSINLSKTAQILLKLLSNNKATHAEIDELNKMIKVLEKPFMDTELAILPSLRKLINYCETFY